MQLLDAAQDIRARPRWQRRTPSECPSLWVTSLGHGCPAALPTGFPLRWGLPDKRLIPKTDVALSSEQKACTSQGPALGA